jgi:small-conductance mechanosensitive channel
LQVCCCIRKTLRGRTLDSLWPDEGRILEMNWHSVRLSTRERDIVVIPNRLLNKEVTVNYSLHDPLHAENIQVSFPAEYPPTR